MKRFLTLDNGKMFIQADAITMVRDEGDYVRVWVSGGEVEFYRGEDYGKNGISDVEYDALMAFVQNSIVEGGSLSQLPAGCPKPVTYPYTVPDYVNPYEITVTT